MTINQSVLIKLIFGIIVTIIYLFYYIFQLSNYGWILIVLSILVLIQINLKYYHPVLGMVLPWILVYSFLSLPISSYSRPIENTTFLLISIPIIIPTILFFYAYRSRNPQKKLELISSRIYNTRFLFTLLLAIILFIINFAYSGYLPLIRGILKGHTDYLLYGIGGLNGLFYAMANAIGIYSYYVFLRFNKKLYLYAFCLMMIIFILCMTRQNMVSLFLEAIIVYTYVRKPLTTKTVILVTAFTIIFFSFLGSFRTANIDKIAGIKTEYNWIPNSLVWVYSYGYFNLLNLDNLVSSGYYGYYNGSSLLRLFPSFMRPEAQMEKAPLEVNNFTVSSYLYPIFKDVDIGGVLIFTILITTITIQYFRKSNTKPSWVNVGIYSVLYFCALFAFFVNFWFFLPIIFQVPFIIIFNKFLIKENWVTSTREKYPQ